MQSHYEINISLNGKHFFATAERSAVTEAHHKKLLAVLRVKFPKSEGYEVSSTFWQCVGHSITVRN